MAETVKENQELDSSTLEAIELFTRAANDLKNVLVPLLVNHSKEEIEKPLLMVIDGVLMDITAAVKDFGFTGSHDIVLPFEKEAKRVAKVLEAYKTK